MFEIMFHGRGGQGAVLAATLLANTAARSGCQTQAFASYGGERRGGKVESYVRIDQEKVLLHSKVYRADLLVIMEDSLAQNPQIAGNLKKGTIVLINTSRLPTEFPDLQDGCVVTIDANRIAVESNLTLPSGMPIINTTILGAIVALVPMLEMEHLLAALNEGKIPAPEKNARVAQEAYRRIKKFLESPQPRWCGENAADASAVSEKYPCYVTRMPPCTANCPAGEDIERTAFFIQGGDFAEALANIREENPFPGTCGRVCPHPCEQNCNRKEFDESLAARSLERAAFDHAGRKQMRKPVKKAATGKKVAVIGAGPAGMTCAYYLSLLGHRVTVFESSLSAGGIPRLAIPEHRLPKEIVDREIKEITLSGMEIKLNSPVREADFAALIREYDACFIAVGAGRPVRLGVPGEDREGVYEGLSFLKQLKAGISPPLGGRVAVVGGGNVAVDCAPSALRLGARGGKPVCLEKRDEMPAYKEEIAQAEEEGIRILNSLGVERISDPDVKSLILELKACTGVYDRDGRFNPAYNEKETRRLEIDTVIVAIGQVPALSFLKESQVRTGITVEVDPETLATGVPGIFAGGDAAGLSGSVVTAVAAGKRAAVSIDLYLNGQDAGTSRSFNKNGAGAVSMRRYLTGSRNSEFDGTVQFQDLNTSYFEHLPRARAASLPVKDRRDSFKEIDPGFSREQAAAEAERCFHCGRCILCENCYIFCPDLAVYLDREKDTFDINRMQCKVCGICINECPRSAIAWEGDGR